MGNKARITVLRVGDFVVAPQYGGLGLLINRGSAGRIVGFTTDHEYAVIKTLNAVISVRTSALRKLDKAAARCVEECLDQAEIGV